MRLVKLRWGVVFLGTTLCTYSRLGVFELENQSLTPLTKLPINSTVFSPKLFFIRASQSVPHKVIEREGTSFSSSSSSLRDRFPLPGVFCGGGLAYGVECALARLIALPAPRLIGPPARPMEPS